MAEPGSKPAYGILAIGDRIKRRMYVVVNLPVQHATVAISAQTWRIRGFE